MRIQLFSGSLVVFVSMAATVAAQHVDILVWDDSGKLGVGLYDFDNQAAVETRVREVRFNSNYADDDPGFTTIAGLDPLPGSAELRFDYLPMTVDTGPQAGYESTLLYWDGVGAVPEFGPTPTDEYEFVYLGIDGPAKADGGDQLTPGALIDTTNGGGGIHVHPFYFLDDNGDGLSVTAPLAGVYLIGIQMTIGDLEASDPFYMLWGTPESSVTPAMDAAALWISDRVDTLFAEPLDGDFNGDGVVDAADYTVWRDGLGTTYQASDYEVWRSNFGAGTPPPPASAATAVPEPTGLLLLASLAAGGACLRSRSTCFFGA